MGSRGEGEFNEARTQSQRLAVPTGTCRCHNTGYVKSVLNHSGIFEWVEAAKLETESIAEDEIEI